MTDINLLPWREIKREQAITIFKTSLISVLVIVALTVFVINYYIGTKIDLQTILNQRITTEVTEYKKHILEIKNLETLRQGLIARMTIIQNLQSTRTLTVRLFAELISILPDGVYVNRMERAGNKIIISGYTESNSNISRLMLNVESSLWIQLPELTEIKKMKEGVGDLPSEFKLSFILKPKFKPGQQYEF